MRRVIYPGSFDPVTNGHLDIIARAKHLFDEVIVAVAHNDLKRPMFSVAERIELLENSIPQRDGVRFVHFDGLLVEYAQAIGGMAVIRGLRAISDFEFEFQMALMNRRLAPALETVFLTPREDCSYLSSRIIKEIARLGGDVSPFVPDCVVGALRSKYAQPRA